VRARALSGCLLLLLLCLAGAPAEAERSSRAGVEISVDGWISPSRLDRHRMGPVSVTIAGSVRAPGRAQSPPLTTIELGFGARGGLSTMGLPTCPPSRLRNATPEQALARCRGALVGRGRLLTEAPLGTGEPLLSRAAALAFNGGGERRRTVLLYAHAASPPTSFVLPFHLRRPRSGGYGVVARASVYRALGRWPRLRAFRLTLGRRYRSEGAWHSYLNARCPLPPRLHLGYFGLARVTYRFAPKPRITETILRPCRTRD